MKMHQRERLVQKAMTSLTKKVTEWLTQLDEELTTFEELQILTSVLSNTVLSTIKYAIRDERHGDFDKEGGLEYQRPPLIAGNRSWLQDVNGHVGSRVLVVDEMTYYVWDEEHQKYSRETTDEV